MLSHLQLKNFKSAKDLGVELRPLTVLAGLNGSGKSSVLQALALLKQTLDQGDAPLTLPLRGALVRLGRSEDVHFEGAETSELSLAVRSSAGLIRFASVAKDEADTLSLAVEGDSASLRRELDSWFQFIQADRMTPAAQYDQASTPDQQRGWLGCRGEFTVDFLHRNEDKRVSDRRHCPGAVFGLDPALLKLIAPTVRLADQTAAWLQMLSPGVRLRAIPVDLADATSLRFQYTSTEIASGTREHRPSNVGFGLTYSLPIIVACLAAEQGGLLLLENPEAHLHPRGQAALGRLLAMCSADGVQVVVETHSDHLLNGIRVAVKQQAIDADSVALHYFSRDVRSGESHIESPRVLPDGQLDRWPDGFFDQWDKSLDALLD
jgi:predicted ATPase